MTPSQPHHAGPPEPDREAFIESTLSGFARRWQRWGLPLWLPCLLATAWHWSQPGAYSLGVPFTQGAAVLAVASLLLNLPSFWLQRIYLRSWLRARQQTGTPINAGSFALRFYLINLGLALTLSVLLWRPLLQLLFFHRLYPVVFWLLPWQAPLGWLLGRWLRRATSGVPPA